MILYITYAFAALFGLTNLLITVLFFFCVRVLRVKNIQTLVTFTIPFFLWVALVYLWKLINGLQMPQLAIIICIACLFISFVMQLKTDDKRMRYPLSPNAFDDDHSRFRQQIIVSQMFSLLIIFIAHFLFILPLDGFDFLLNHFRNYE